jgi:hypothetical protein
VGQTGEGNTARALEVGRAIGGDKGLEGIKRVRVAGDHEREVALGNVNHFTCVDRDKFEDLGTVCGGGRDCDKK